MAKDDDVPAAYALVPSDGPGTQLTSCLLDDENYLSWSRAMLTAIRSKNKLGFINGDIKQPEKSSALFDKWDQCNSIVLAWIYNHLERKIQRTVACAGNAKDLWDLLRVRFSQGNVTEVHRIKARICLLRQAGSSVREYFTELTTLWDELEALQEPPVCTCGNCNCGARAALATRWENEKLHQFLIGLDSEYSGTRSAILDSDPLPTVSQAYSKVSHAETQRRANEDLNSAGDRVGFAALADRSHGGVNGGMKSGTREQWMCDYCGRPGHHRGICYHLHGFPSQPRQDLGAPAQHTFPQQQTHGGGGGGGSQASRGPGQQNQGHSNWKGRVGGPATKGSSGSSGPRQKQPGSGPTAQNRSNN
ncbi:hypothetical protein MLD38_039450 [Melastoma candidum]|uniref:Uncharacterized protein n=1 Tax=Melastoma candidum TaxID=119954 RepID=A0ACB9L3A8_9MYRT|nr:hypothetical protein MLD38_039450 [Melastoma candidum]